MPWSGISISWRSLRTSNTGGSSVLRRLYATFWVSSLRRFARRAVSPRTSHRVSDKVACCNAIWVTACTETNAATQTLRPLGCWWTAKGGCAPSTGKPRRACVMLWTAPRGGRSCATGGNIAGVSPRTSTAGTPHVAPLCTTASFVPCKGNTFAGARARGDAPRRGTSMQWPVERVLVPRLPGIVVRLVFGGVALLALSVPRRDRRGPHETHAAARPTSVPVAATALWTACALLCGGAGPWPPGPTRAPWRWSFASIAIGGLPPWARYL